MSQSKMRRGVTRRSEATSGLDVKGEASGVMEGDTEKYRLAWVLGKSFYLCLPLLVPPFVHMTQRSKWADPDATEYIAWKQGFESRVLILMRENGLPQPFFGDKQRLGISVHVRRDQRPDATNLLKAIEDAMQGVLYKNDRRLRDVHLRATERGDPRVKFRIWVLSD